MVWVCEWGFNLAHSYYDKKNPSLFALRGMARGDQKAIWNISIQLMSLSQSNPLSSSTRDD